MHVYVSDYDWAELLPIFFGGLVGICIISLLLFWYMKNKDNSKPVQKIRGKILEKPIQQGNVAWYVIECENGRRLQLRSFQANQLIITVGDVGIISYKGKTIQSFRRES